MNFLAPDSFESVGSPRRTPNTFPTESLTTSRGAPHLQMGRGCSTTGTAADSGKVTPLLTDQGRRGAPNARSSLVGTDNAAGPLRVCVEPECLFLRSPGQTHYGTNSACAKRATYPDPLVVPVTVFARRLPLLLPGHTQVSR